MQPLLLLLLDDTETQQAEAAESSHLKVLQQKYLNLTGESFDDELEEESDLTRAELLSLELNVTKNVMHSLQQQQPKQSTMQQQEPIMA